MLIDQLDNSQRNDRGKIKIPAKVFKVVHGNLISSLVGFEKSKLILIAVEKIE